MSELVDKSIQVALTGKNTYCKFLSANDSGETGSHQVGILISKSAKKMLFTDIELEESHILKKSAKIKWQDDFTTDCTFTWYKSKNELRITGFGRGFHLLNEEQTGSLFVLIQISADDFEGFIFETDDDIQEFLDSFGLTPAETNRLIEISKISSDDREKEAINSYIGNLTDEFPSSFNMSSAARIIYEYSTATSMLKGGFLDPDSQLLAWTECEYRLFRAIENERYGKTIYDGFKSVEEFISLANVVLNRRKSRAGKSLEHHLSAIFEENKIQFDSQKKTEGNKKPDFVFPSIEAYHDMSYSIDSLCVLAAKTTCKDRWRQILNEADRLRDENKYLCTMQQGISGAQMDEMQAEKVILVVPKKFITFYPKDRRDRIWTIGMFVEYIKRIEGIE